jgi:hypothetical protein
MSVWSSEDMPFGAAAALDARQGNADRFAFPAAHGRAAIFGACKALEMKESGNRAFRFPC